MQKKYGFNRDMTKDQYIINQLKTHNSSHCMVGLTKAEMYELLDQENIVYKKAEGWESLFAKVLELEGITLDELAKRKGIGVSSGEYKDTFGITQADVKRLEKFGVLEVVGEYVARNYGKNLYCPVYSLEQFDAMSEEDMTKLMEEYPRGKRMGNKGKK